MTDPLKKALALMASIDAAEKADRLGSLYGSVVSDDEFALMCAGSLEPDGRPYPWQAQFHNAGAVYNQRGLLGGNRIGKSETPAAEVAIHATGLYPDWWRGRRFEKPVEVLVAGETNETTRNIQQKKLFGGFELESTDPDGTGWIPKEKILSHDVRVCGMKGVYDTVSVRHVSGGVSKLYQKTYEQGWTKFQGVEYDVAWLDEEPDDAKIYPEVLMRLLSRKGILMNSRTPLFGMTEMIAHLKSGKPGTFVMSVTWDMAPHLDPDEKAVMIASIPPHELECRTKGIPMMGAGAVFPISDEEIACDPFPTPDHWRYIAGMDFGVEHPTACVWLAYNSEADVVYVTDCYKKGRDHSDPQASTVANHASAIRSRDRDGLIPVAWPHDGIREERAGGGINLKTLYENEGVNMLYDHARYEENEQSGSGGNVMSVERGLLEMYQRMVDGRLRVFRHLTDWFDEKRMYHRKDGRVVSVNDDLLSATRVALMMLRHARPKVFRRQHVPPPPEKSNPLMAFVK